MTSDDTIPAERYDILDDTIILWYHKIDTVSGTYFRWGSVDGLLLDLSDLWDGLPNLLGDVAVHLHTLHRRVVHAVEVGWEEEGEPGECVGVCAGVSVGV